MMLRTARPFPFLVTLVGLCLLTSVTTARAGFIIQVYEDGSAVPFATATAAAGQDQVFLSSQTANFTAIVEAAFSNRLDPSSNLGVLAITSNVTRTDTAGTHTLRILATATDYNLPVGTSAVLGSTGSASWTNSTAGEDFATYQSFASAANAEFGMTTSTQLQTTNAPTVTNPPASTLFTPNSAVTSFSKTAAPYSLTNETVITLGTDTSATIGGITTVTAGTPNAVPTPSNLILALTAVPFLGAGVFVTRFLRKRRAL